MQVKFHNSVLHFDKVMPLFKSLNLHIINTRKYVVSTVVMEEFSSYFTQMFTPTGQCSEPILPLCQLMVKATLEGQILTYKMFSTLGK
jgi:hypothetical protein